MSLLAAVFDPTAWLVSAGSFIITYATIRTYHRLQDSGEESENGSIHGETGGEDRTTLAYRDRDVRNYTGPRAAYLCDFCNEVDLEALFGTHESEDGVYAVRVLDELSSRGRPRSYGCRFCGLLSSLVSAEGHTTDGTRVIIRIRRRYQDQTISVAVNTNTGPKRARDTRTDLTSSYEIVDISPARYAPRYYAESNNCEFWRESRRLFDVDQIQTWIQRCHRDHGEQCHPETSQAGGLFTATTTDSRRSKRIRPVPPPPIRLIDIKRRCIILANGPNASGEIPRFVALSYRWRDPEPNQLTRVNVKKWGRTGTLDKISLPRTVRMAMKLVGDLGVQYLWVDALCILQDKKDDNIEREQVLSKMHWIYMNAYFTLCAAGGTDANAPLFGLSREAPWTSEYARPESVPSSEHIRGMELSVLQTGKGDNIYPRMPSHVSYNALEDIRASTWNTRAWTFQEKVCSPRSLVLTESGAVWWCQCEILRQDSWGSVLVSQSPLIRTLSFPLQANTRRDEETLGCTERAESYSRILEGLLDGYVVRQLGRSGDFLNAFAGILGYMEEPLGKHHLGLPQGIFANAIAWTTSSRHERGSLVVPSWSWVGWRFTGPGLSIPSGGNILTIYRCDLPYEPFLSQGSGVVLSNHFSDKDAAMENAILEVSRASEAGLLGNLTPRHILAFYTSSSIVGLRRPSNETRIDGLIRWEICDLEGATLGSTILLPVEYLGSVGDLSHGRAIVIHSTESSAGVAYRLMFIEEKEYRSVRFGISSVTVASRLGVSEGTISADQWFSLEGIIGTQRHHVHQKLILLG